jgi:hypothetical protein
MWQNIHVYEYKFDDKVHASKIQLKMIWLLKVNKRGYKIRN